MEKEKKKKMKDENTDLKNQNDDNVRKVERVYGEMTEMRDNYEAQLENMRRERGMEDARKEGLEMQVTRLQSELGKQEYIHSDIVKRKDRDMKLLEERVKDRQKDLIETKRELIDVRNDLKKSYKLVNDSNKRAEEAERRCEELGKNVEAQAQGRPPVANIEEPGPSRKVEEAEPEDPTVESSQLQTTGGIYGDTEGDETFTKPAPPPSPRGKKEDMEKGEKR